MRALLVGSERGEAAQLYGTCGDANESVQECAAPPLRGADDPIEERWARAILGDPDDDASV